MECCATLEAPPDVVDSGVTLSVHYAIILDGPFKFPEKWERTSVVLYIDCPEKRLLKEPLCIKLRHWAVCQPDALAVMKAKHTLDVKRGEFMFEQLDITATGHFKPDSSFFELKNHFCLVCIAIKRTKCATFSMHDTRCYLMKVPDDEMAYDFRIFLMYGVPSWIDVS